jgi:valyl-tRNA synthetase
LKQGWNTLHSYQQLVAGGSLRSFHASDARWETETVTEKHSQTAEEKLIALRKKKDAKRLERLDRQRARLEQQNVGSQDSSCTYSHCTQPGGKKYTACALPDTYSPTYVETAWYDWWEKEGYFTPEYHTKLPLSNKDLKEKFIICLPPPNVTGYLHLGHAMGNAVEDAIVRWNRMSGRMTLWNPGVDHAGIATQIVVEQKLWREQKLTRHDVGRERFIEQVLKWKDEKVQTIYDQMRRMGSSLDWTRSCFTLDPKLSHAVTEAFIRLFDSGDIYRSKRLVNWSCTLRSAISDIEVEDLPVNGKTYLEVPGYDRKIQFGVLCSFAYPVDGLDDEIVVATTRLETMLGDVAVAVHPEDIRYTHLHGRHVRHPLLPSCLLPIITDTSVDKNFGTGAVKVTPAHDQADFELASRHKLPLVNILDDEGKLINVPSPFQGLKRFEAREKVQSALEALGLFCGTVDHSMVLPVCSRSKDIVEYLMKDQWFVACQQMANNAIQAVQSGRLSLIPGHYDKQWTEWLQTTRDWCISRQLWWGHRIPAYRVLTADKQAVTINDTEVWVAAADADAALKKASERCKLPSTQLSVEQDEDVLDTWFSSALFPFSIHGWPEETKDLTLFYPSNLLETASDIMFFWVARMVMLGEKLTGQLPFNQVLFHSIIRDSHGRKMSKSLGNVIDPMDVINGISLQELLNKLDNSNLSPAEVNKAKTGIQRDFPLGIAQCGADALRFTLCSYNFTAHVVNVDVSHVKASRHFCNKIWQAFRFFLMNIDENFQPADVHQLYAMASSTDQWILSRLSSLVEACDQGFKTYNLTQVARSLHTFWWSELCDVYLEYVKAVMQTKSSAEINISKSILCCCMDTGLRLLSPFMPFISEELYQRLPITDLAPSIMVASYPQPNKYTWQNSNLENDMFLVRNIIGQVLSLRKDLNLTKAKADLYIEVGNTEVHRAVTQHQLLLTTLSRSKNVIVVQVSPPSGCIRLPLNDACTLHIDLKGVVDERLALSQLTQQRQKFEDELQKLQRILDCHNLSPELLLANEEKIVGIRSIVHRLSQVICSLQKLTS